MNCRLCAACVVLVAVLAVNMVSAKAVDNKQPNLNHVTVVKDVRDFVRNHPGVKLQRLTKQPNMLRDTSVRYTIGGRVAGDHLVAQSADVFAYPAKKDVSIQLTYPESGTGKIVTFVELVCIQDSNNGNAYIVAGGINQRFISIILEANQTENFSYSAQFYGSD